MHDAILLMDELDRAGVELCFVHQPELTSASQSRFLRFMLAAFADFEREIIAARIAETRVYLKQHGQRLAGRVPFGYDADPISKQLSRNNIEARRVRAIFRRAARGELPSEISRRVNHLGWRTQFRQSQQNKNHRLFTLSKNSFGLFRSQFLL